MSARSIERSVARKLYTNFTKQWRDEMRTKGVYGQKASFKRPTFSQWFAMHQRDADMMKESTPSDVQEYLGLDPWTEQAKPSSDGSVTTEKRGVMTMSISGDDGDE
jgi:hypothetical protein